MNKKEPSSVGAPTKRKVSTPKRKSSTSPEKKERLVPITVVTTVAPTTEHYYKLPPDVFKSIDKSLSQYKLPLEEVLEMMALDPGARLEERPKECIRFTLLRLKHKMTQGQMAIRLRTEQGRISLIERGQSGISDEMAKRIAEEFKVDPALFRSPSPKRGGRRN